MYVREFGTDACINAMQMFHFSPPRVECHKYIIFASVCQAAGQKFTGVHPRHGGRVDKIHSEFFERKTRRSSMYKDVH